MKRLIKILLLGISCFSLTGCFSTLFLIMRNRNNNNTSSSEAESGSLIIKEKRSAKFYINESANLNFKAYTLRDYQDITYIDFKEFHNSIFVEIASSTVQETMDRTVKKSIDKQTITYKNAYGDYIFNPVEDTLYISNLNRNLFFMACVGEDFVLANGVETRYVTYTNESYDRPSAKIFYLNNYHIDIVRDNDNIYLPINTFIDIFLTTNMISVAYNGKDLYFTGAFGDDVTGQTASNTLEKNFYDESPWHNSKTRSQSLADFTYNELCFAIDYFYGLKEQRGVYNANDVFNSMGIKNDMLSTNAQTYNAAIIEFGCHWLYDGHSGLTKYSPFKYASNHSELRQAHLNSNHYYAKLMTAMNDLTELRDLHGKSQGLTFYGNTAILSFDMFIKSGRDLSDRYEAISYADLAGLDTYWMYKKAFDEIESRTDIQNIVFDTTLNVGGMIDALVWVQAFTNINQRLTFKNTLTGEITRTSYSVDLNRDGAFNTLDTYQGKYNFYLMTSELSFSCGNAYPTFTKESGAMTIIGEKSGGGSCAVGALTTACGDVFSLSSTFQFGTYSGGVFQDNEDGIAPDYDLNREFFYSDYSINNFVNSL